MKNEWNKWKNHFYGIKGDVGMSVHEKERKQEDAYTSLASCRTVRGATTNAHAFTQPHPHDRSDESRTLKCREGKMGKHLGLAMLQ